MNKTGQIETGWLWISYLVLAAIVVAVLMNYIGGQKSDIQGFYLNDITFLVNHVLSSEFDEEYTYELAKDLAVEITEEEVKISFDGKTISKKYIKNENYKIDYAVKENKLILRRTK